MNNCVVNFKQPENEPIKKYLQGSEERIKLEAELQRQLSEKIEIPLIIDGKEIFTENRKPIICPHNHKTILGYYCQAGEKELKMAIESAMNARKVWQNFQWEDRTAIYLKAADLITKKYTYILNAATMLNQSKNIQQAEIDSTCETADFFRFNTFFMQKIYQNQPMSTNSEWNRIEYKPLDGFILAISPFNFTAIAANLVSAPIMMGNVGLWKPASTSILSNYYLMKLYIEAGMPNGVINFVPCQGSMLSSIVLKHKDFSGLHFTGSTNVFNTLWKTIANNLNEYKNYPRIVGETGGKDYIFAHNSANIQDLVMSIIKGSFEYQGQKCSACSRAYIPESLKDKTLDLLKKECNKIKMGSTLDPKNFVNAVIDENSFDKINEYIKYVKNADDAEIFIGGHTDKSLGYFIEPTVILTSNPTFKTMQEEIFGPVLTIYIYPDDKLDETLNLLDNTSPYALTGAIFAKERTVINYLTEKLANTAGNFYVNDKPTGAVVGQQPFGGSRASGTNDKAGSNLNLLRWTSPRTIKESFSVDPNWKYPYIREYD